MIFKDLDEEIKKREDIIRELTGEGEDQEAADLKKIIGE